MKSKLIAIITFVFLAFVLWGTAYAEDPLTEGNDAPAMETENGGEPPAEGDEGPEEPAFKNQTELQRAINLANALAQEADPELENAIKEADEGDAEAEEEAESLLAEEAGVTPEDIAQMREDGMGWGEIAHELGLHPGLLGMGHTKTIRNRNRHMEEEGNLGDEPGDPEIAEATARNFKSGLSKGHGMSAEKGEKAGGSQKGDSEKANKGKDGGNGGGNGNGNSGGNGNGSSGKNK
jgi:hypothetical protein